MVTVRAGLIGYGLGGRVFHALLIAAVLIAALGTAMILLYVQGIDDRATQGQELVEVLTATETIEAGELDLLVYNPQSTTSAADRIVEAAREHGVDVVEISEIPPAGTNFLDYMASVVDQIAQAAAHH